MKISLTFYLALLPASIGLSLAQTRPAPPVKNCINGRECPVRALSGSSRAKKFYWEAESATSIQSPLKKVLPGPNKKYSGQGYLQMPSKNKKGQGRATYRVKVKEAGIYYVWVRVLWPNSSSNFVTMSVNGGRKWREGLDRTINRWHWVGGVQRVKHRAGVNTVDLYAKQPGVKVDRFLFDPFPPS